MSTVYLRPDVQAEPLVDQWYAWMHLIPPATAARNLKERHVRIMESYITSPLIHANAVKNPKMLGGPFIDYGGERVEEIRELLNRTIAKRGLLLRLATAIEELDRLLESRAKGESLESVYFEVPDILRGFVEMYYDLNNHPSWRLIEPLLYRSPFYQTDGQAVRLSITTGDDRPFVLSTPRLADSAAMQLSLPFASDVLDELFTSKVQPKPFEDLAERCTVPPEDRTSFRSLFTCEEPELLARRSIHDCS